MRPISILRLGSSGLCLSLITILSGCGGGSAAGSNPTNPTTPQATEVLYANGEQGLHAFSIDLSTGLPTAIQTIPFTGSTISSPGGPVVVPSSQNFVYAVDNGGAGIDAYTVGEGGILGLVKGSPFILASSFASWPYITSIAVTPDGTYLYAVDPVWGMIAGYQADPKTGDLTAMADGFRISPSGGVTDTSPEEVMVDSSGQFLYVSDENAAFSSTKGTLMGIDELNINASDGNVAPDTNSPFLLPDNTLPGPTQIVIDPTGHFLYVALSQPISVAGFTRNPTTGELTPMAGSPFPIDPAVGTGINPLAISPSGKFLYAFDGFNRSTYGFAINPTSGTLSQIAGSPFAGQQTSSPYSTDIIGEGPVILDPSGQYLYIAGGDAEIEIYQVDQSSGSLTPVHGSPVPIIEGVNNFAFVQLH